MNYMESIRVSVYPNDTVIRPKLDNRDSISVSVFFPLFYSAQTGSEVKPSKGNPLFSGVKRQKSEADHLLQSNVEVYHARHSTTKSAYYA